MRMHKKIKADLHKAGISVRFAFMNGDSQYDIRVASDRNGHDQLILFLNPENAHISVVDIDPEKQQAVLCAKTGDFISNYIVGKSGRELVLMPVEKSIYSVENVHKQLKAKYGRKKKNKMKLPVYKRGKMTFSTAKKIPFDETAKIFAHLKFSPVGNAGSYYHPEPYFMAEQAFIPDEAPKTDRSLIHFLNFCQDLYLEKANRIYVRGEISHPEYTSLHLTEWCKCYWAG